MHPSLEIRLGMLHLYYSKHKKFKGELTIVLDEINFAFPSNRQDGFDLSG